jgi:DUF1680 family protein
MGKCRRFILIFLAFDLIAAVLNTNAAAESGSAAGGDSAAPRIVAQGVLRQRMDLAERRMTEGHTPRFTRDFVLADVALDRPRRFSEYSGDLSGRFIEAWAVGAFGADEEMKALIDRLLSYQKSDGRFGDASLEYTASAIGARHMALLWGNGRLMIGLLACYKRLADPRILGAARRLGDFILAVEKQCAEPDVRKRLEGQGASGFICFTQQIEGLVELYRATGERKYLDASASIAPLLGPRGIQHAHGYLATLRGMVDLAVAAHDAEMLKTVESAYDDLVRSPDFTIFGSVLEYFGWKDPAYTPEDLKALMAASGDAPRDEGCGHADFLRLSLALWRITGKMEYLERAEACFENGLLPNQFDTGDFGSRVTFGRGIRPAENVDRAWWCCTMHGYRAIPDVLESVITRYGKDGIALNLYQNVDWSDNRISIKARVFGINIFGNLIFQIEVVDAPSGKCTIALRKPSWADSMKVQCNSGQVRGNQDKDYFLIRRVWKAGDMIEMELACRMVLQRRDGVRLKLDDPSKGTLEAALFHGPWLMGISETDDPLFYGEPWPGNVFFISPKEPFPSIGGESTISFKYQHDGFPGRQSVTLRPVRDFGLKPQAIWGVWFNFRRE